MSLIRPLVYGKLCVKNHAVLFMAVRNHWNKDFKPAPYPKTDQERLAAAKKYGLEPEDYKPFPDDGPGRGDYPNMPIIAAESRDPYYPYDNPELKRNFNEPINADAEMYGDDRYNLNFRHRVPLRTQVLQFLGCMTGCYMIFFFCENFKWFLALSEKQYPAAGAVHYTFEPVE